MGGLLNDDHLALVIYGKRILTALILAVAMAQYIAPFA